MDDIFAAVDCNDGEFKIVTDPAKIEEIKKEEIRRRRKQGRIQQELSKEPWFTRRTSDQVAELLKVQGEDGAFLIRSSGYRASDNPEAETFVLLLFFNDQVESYRIFQRAMLGQIVFYFANCGKLVFPSLRSLVEFHHFNLGSLPCLLREYPRLPWDTHPPIRPKFASNSWSYITLMWLIFQLKTWLLRSSFQENSIDQCYLLQFVLIGMPRPDLAFFSLVWLRRFW